MKGRVLKFSDTLLKRMDATVGRLLCVLIGYADYLRSGKGVAQRLPDARNVCGRRILVVRPGGLGDMILLLPALQTLQRAFPNAAIDMLCEHRNACVLPLAGFQGRILYYDRNRHALWRRLRKSGYQVVIDTEQFHHLSAVVARLSGAPTRIGFKINPVRNLLYTHLVNYALDASEAQQFMRLLEPFGLKGCDASLDGRLAKPAVRRARTPALPSGETVAVYAAASTPYKQWPFECFKQLLAVLTDDLDLNVALVGGKEATVVSRRLAAVFNGRSTAASPSRVLSLAGETSLLETAAILEKSRLFVGADCGLTHLAVAVGLPTVTLFGPSDPLKWGHLSERHQIIHQQLSCSPCFIFGYHRLCRHRDCMTAITVEDVAAACRRAMEG